MNPCLGRTTALALAVWTCLIAAGQLAAADEKKATTKDLENCEMYPLGVGREWVYRSGPLELIEQVTRHEEVAGELCARVETVFGGRVVAFEHVTVRPDGVYRVAIAGKPVEPPLRFLKLPAKEGETWSVDSKVLGQAVTGDFSMAKESLKIGADDVQSLVVTGSRFKIGESDLKFSYYFVPGVGKAKQIVVMNGQETLLELPALPTQGVAEAPEKANKL